MTGEAGIKELPPQERMALEIARAAKVLGVEVPAEEYARIVMGLLGKLSKFTARRYIDSGLDSKPYTTYSIPPDRDTIRNKHTVSLAQLGGMGKIQSGIVLWGIGFSGNEPIPNEVCLVKMNPGGPAESNFVPFTQYDIAEVSVVTGRINFDGPKNAHPQSVQPTAQIFIRGTTR